MKYNLMLIMKPKNIKNKIKNSINNQRQYRIFKSKQLMGLLIMIFASFFLVVSMVQVTGFTTLYLSLIHI